MRVRLKARRMTAYTGGIAMSADRTVAVSDRNDRHAIEVFDSSLQILAAFDTVDKVRSSPAVKTSPPRVAYPLSDQIVLTDWTGHVLPVTETVVGGLGPPHAGWDMTGRYLVVTRVDRKPLVEVRDGDTGEPRYGMRLDYAAHGAESGILALAGTRMVISTALGGEECKSFLFDAADRDGQLTELGFDVLSASPNGRRLAVGGDMDYPPRAFRIFDLDAMDVTAPIEWTEFFTREEDNFTTWPIWAADDLVLLTCGAGHFFYIDLSTGLGGMVEDARELTAPIVVLDRFADGTLLTLGRTTGELAAWTFER